MKHHFGDFLDREGDYWTIVPNVQRYAYGLSDVEAGSESVQVATISKDDPQWERVLTFPNLCELTLHEPSREQLLALPGMPAISRLRITHARPKDLSFISPMEGVQELVLEYVSGFDDLAPLRSLARLRSLHLENLRRVHDFSGLRGIESLRYLYIGGTLDWKQPIDDFEFVRGLPSLEVLRFGQVINRLDYPASLPILSLKKLKKIKIGWSMLDARELALLEVGLQGVSGADWGPLRRFKATDGEWFEFTGKKAGRAKCGHPKSQEKCDAYTQQYEAMKEDARRTIEAAGGKQA